MLEDVRYVWERRLNLPSTPPRLVGSKIPMPKGVESAKVVFRRMNPLLWEK